MERNRGTESHNYVVPYAEILTEKELVEYFVFAQAFHVVNEFLNPEGLKVKAA